MQELSTLMMKFDKAMEAGKQAREDYHVAVGQKMKTLLDAEIDSRLSDKHGTVKRWQVVHVGSGGGYVAIRATSMGDGKRPARGAGSPGAITNYLENGHAIRKASGKWKRKTSRVKKLRVDGRGFYLAARKQAQMIALQEADRITRAIKEALT